MDLWEMFLKDRWDEARIDFYLWTLVIFIVFLWYEFDNSHHVNILKMVFLGLIINKTWLNVVKWS